MTSKIEVYGHSSWLYSEQRSTGIDQSEKSRSSRFADSWLGMNYQFKDNSTSGLIGFFELALAEKQQNKIHHAKSYSAGLTTYYTLDPVVFSLTSVYRLNQSRQSGNERHNPGNRLLVNPSVSFAANEKITLSTGLRWPNTQASQRDNISNGSRKTSTDLVWGVGYGPTSEDTLNVTLTANNSGRNGADLRFTWLHSFKSYHQMNN